MIEHAHQLDAKRREAIRQLMRSPACVARACGEHDPAWLDVLRDALKHDTSALLAWQGSELVGALPLALTRSPLFGRHLVSLPYVNRAGLLTADRGVGERLIAEAVALADRFDARYLELRHHGGPFASDHFTHTRDAKVRMVMDLPDSVDALWNRYKAKVRNQVRKGDAAHLAVRFGGKELLAGFYGVFATNMRDLGTPVYPRRLFAAMLAHLGARCEIAVVTLESVPIAGAVLVHDQAGAPPTTQVPSASCLRRYNDVCANMWMYHHLLARAIDRGARAFDFGRSSEGSGTYRFKKQWGAEPHPTPWQVHLRRGELDDVRPDHPRYRRRIERWQKLPVWVTRAIGPTIVRGIP
ncbi:MAG: FemAB family XrtA/PEP-CTERM system-associated protein [Phycisphaeraceae bacterium]